MDTDVERTFHVFGFSDWEDLALCTWHCITMLTPPLIISILCIRTRCLTCNSRHHATFPGDGTEEVVDWKPDFPSPFPACCYNGNPVSARPQSLHSLLVRWQQGLLAVCTGLCPHLDAPPLTFLGWLWDGTVDYRAWGCTPPLNTGNHTETACRLPDGTCTPSPSASRPIPGCTWRYHFQKIP